MPKPSLIGLCGFAQSGKDTTADRLVLEHGWTRDAFADDLKRSLLAINPWVPTGSPDYAFRPLADIVEDLGWDTAKRSFEVRRLLGATGTEGGWMIHGKRLWIDRVADRLDQLPRGARLVVADVRFPEEEAWLRERGGLLVRVDRPDGAGLGGELGAHSSEAVSRLTPDETLVNDGTLEELYEKVDAIVA